LSLGEGEPITTIYLVRHAHADWRDDEARQLSESGQVAAQVVADLLSALPITTLYSSPHRRSIETAAPLATRLGIGLELMRDLRERELPVVPPGEFNRAVEETWHSPASAVAGGESNRDAQTRGLAAVRSILTQHLGQHVVVCTHGTLLTLILNGLDSTFGYEFWRRLSFPDVYQVEFEGLTLARVQRIWERDA
jgi:2,3-bisphosphoglycerate-dependent phosphoglycerate mutase